MSIKKVPISELIEDFDLYPRTSIDSTHVRHIVEALEAGVTLPPIMACAKTKRIVDGLHRKRAYQRHLGNDGEVMVDFVRFENEGDLYLEAMRSNASHGRNLTPFDRAHAIMRATEFKIRPQAIATALNITVEKIKETQTQRCATVKYASSGKSAKSKRKRIPLKAAVSHLAGQELTPEQAECMTKIGGNQQIFFVNQIILFVENDLLDRKNEKLMERLRTLRDLLKGI